MRKFSTYQLFLSLLILSGIMLNCFYSIHEKTISWEAFESISEVPVDTTDIFIATTEAKPFLAPVFAKVIYTIPTPQSEIFVDTLLSTLYLSIPPPTRIS
jgi:hypothetical protein